MNRDSDRIQITWTPESGLSIKGPATKQELALLGQALNQAFKTLSEPEPHVSTNGELLRTILPSDRRGTLIYAAGAFHKRIAELAAHKKWSRRKKR